MNTYLRAQISPSDETPQAEVEHLLAMWQQAGWELVKIEIHPELAPWTRFVYFRRVWGGDSDAAD